MSHGIDPKLFGLVDIYAKKLQGAKSGEPVGDDDILFFCQNLFVQFFQFEVKSEITGFDGKSKTRAVQRLTELEGKSDPAVLTMIAKYIELANDWDKIKGTAYGKSTEFWNDFHCSVLPDLLAATEKYAVAVGDKKLQAAIGKAGNAYREATKALCP